MILSSPLGGPRKIKVFLSPIGSGLSLSSISSSSKVKLTLSFSSSSSTLNFNYSTTRTINLIVASISLVPINTLLSDGTARVLEIIRDVGEKH